MALHQYITPSGITHTHLKLFQSGVLEPYCNEANNQYEDIAAQNGIINTLIAYPIPNCSERYLNAYINYRFAEDSQYTNNVEITDNDMYTRMHKDNYDKCRILLKDLTPDVIRGVANNSPVSYSVSTGTSHRKD